MILVDILIHIKQTKWTWAGHIMRRTNNQWSVRATEWIPSEGKELNDGSELSGVMKFKKESNHARLNKLEISERPLSYR